MCNNAFYQVEPILGNFEPISIEQLDKSSLLSRYDTKFVLDIHNLPEIFEELKQSYFALEVQGKRIFKYENLYFDTNEYRLFNDHINGKSSRCKVRYRNYSDLDRCYFEIKSKNNKSLTTKQRLKSRFQNSINEEAQFMLLKSAGIKPDSMKPKLYISYSRITLVNKFKREKITFDTSLVFKNTIADYDLPDLLIVEVKHPGYSSNSEFIEFLGSKHIKNMRISKYCTGSILTNPELKYNRYKPKLMYIKKLNNY